MGYGGRARKQLSPKEWQVRATWPYFAVCVDTLVWVFVWSVKCEWGGCFGSGQPFWAYQGHLPLAGQSNISAIASMFPQLCLVGQEEFMALFLGPSVWEFKETQLFVLQLSQLGRYLQNNWITKWVDGNLFYCKTACLCVGVIQPHNVSPNHSISFNLSSYIQTVY